MSVNRYLHTAPIQRNTLTTFTSPLAQTFFVDRTSFITKVDLYFERKDDRAPVNIEIRKVVNGNPSNIIIPLSEVSVPSANIRTSSNSLISTTVTFPSPVYVDPGEYALCLFTDSLNTRVWISQLGEADVSTKLPIQKQPSVGVLFKSNNSSTWTEDQEKDLKFAVYRAKFTPGVTTTVDMWLGNVTSSVRRLPYDPLTIYPNSTTMRIRQPNHFLKNGSYTLISQIAPNQLVSNLKYYNMYPANISGYRSLVSNVTSHSYTVNLPSAPNNTSIVNIGESLRAYTDLQYTTIFPAVTVLQPADSEVLHFIKTTDSDYVEDIEYINVYSEKDNEFDSVRIVPSEANRKALMSSAKGFQYRIEMTTNDEYSAPIIDLQKTTVIFSTNKIDNPTFDTENILPTDIPTVFHSSGTGTISFNKLSANVATVNIENTNGRANALQISPGMILKIAGSSNHNGNVRVLSVSPTGSNIFVFANVRTEANNTDPNSNIVISYGRRFVAEEAPFGGTASAKYVTRTLNFINPSTAFKVFLEVNKPPLANIKIYYRTSRIGDAAPIQVKEFIEITNLNLIDSLGTSFYEIEKIVENVESFDGFQLKIVLLSDSPAQIPKCRNLRIVSLA